MTRLAQAALGLGVVALAALVVAGTACQSRPRAFAGRIADRSAIVGGQRSLGDVGDYVLHNGRIRAVVQNVGYSRGFGVFGGSLIDLDIERPARPRGSLKQTGFDGFSEMFPAFFLEAIEPCPEMTEDSADPCYGKTGVAVVNDGSDGNAAVVRVTGAGANFLTTTQEINRILLNQDGNGRLDFTVDYRLEPAARWLTVRVTLTNPTEAAYSFPSDSLPVPVGFVALLGEGQRLFLPGQAGYDARYTLDRLYKQKWQIPAIGGVVTPMWITEGAGVSYGMMPLEPNTYVLRSKDQYGVQPDDPKESVFIPLVSGSFMGAFVTAPPVCLPGKKETCPENKPDSNTFSYAVNLLVGNGDAASVHEVFYQAKAKTVRHIGGVLLEERSLKPMEGGWVVVKDARGFVTSARVGPGGRFQAPVPPGTYELVAVAPPRTPKPYRDVAVTKDAGAHVALTVEELGQVAVTVVDDTGRLVPAKISVEGTIEPEHSGRDPKSFLFDLSVGESWRPSDLVPDDPAKPETRRYLEAVAMTPSGRGTVAVRPGTYTVHVSRGPEYELSVAREVKVGPGELIELGAMLRRAFDASDYVSGDFHVHSINSIDSGMALAARITSYAAEGVDYLASTDHNFVSDFAPTVELLGLTDFVKTSVGLELTTLELGHFNVWPIRFETGPITHGSFEWFQVPAAGLFQTMRAMGVHGPTETVVQVNHPRDSIQGYFAAFAMNQAGDASDRSAEIVAPKGPAFVKEAFSYDFDAIELFNGKRIDQLHNHVAPDPIPPPPPGQSYPAWLQNIQPGQRVDDKSGNPAFPGVVDDWFHLLARKDLAARRRFPTAMGNSDSHGASAEAGCPRNFVRVGRRPATMKGLSELDVTRAILQHAVVVSNGPLLEIEAGAGAQRVGVGGCIPAAPGKVPVRLSVKAASWVDVSEVRLYRNGAVLQTFPVQSGTEPERFKTAFDVDVGTEQIWVVAEAVGRRDMWPVMTPYEVPPVLVSDAVGGIAASFPGFLTRYFGLSPSIVQRVTPYALTNPIWIGGACPEGSQQALVAAAARPAAAVEARPRRTVDLWQLIGQFHGE